MNSSELPPTSISTRFESHLRARSCCAEPSCSSCLYFQCAAIPDSAMWFMSSAEYALLRQPDIAIAPRVAPPQVVEAYFASLILQNERALLKCLLGTLGIRQAEVPHIMPF